MAFHKREVNIRCANEKHKVVSVNIQAFGTDADTDDVFAIHRSIKDGEPKGKYWVITHSSTGLSIGKDLATRREAFEAADRVLVLLRTQPTIYEAFRLSSTTAEMVKLIDKRIFGKLGNLVRQIVQPVSWQFMESSKLSLQAICRSA